MLGGNRQIYNNNNIIQDSTNYIMYKCFLEFVTQIVPELQDKTNLIFIDFYMSEYEDV